MSIHKIFLFLVVSSFFLACEKDVLPPEITSINHLFGPAELLVTIEGRNLANITEVAFSGQPVNFNTAFNSDIALLMRIPTNVPLGPHEVTLTTAGGTATTNFRVTLDPPSIFRVSPTAALPGDMVSIVGKNFYPPLEVFFFDSVAAEIILENEDSLVVQVPEGISKGRIRVNANGGTTLSPIDFFSVNTILVNDFDGNGMRPETNRWIFVGEVDQTPNDAVQSTNPAPLDGNFLKLSGQDNLDISWIGGAQTNFGFPGDTFETFGITTSPNNTLIELDINNNGRDQTYILLILLENGGSPNDFVYKIPVDWEGWRTVSFPLNRFTDVNEVIVDPSKVRTLKIHLIDEEDSNQLLEINVDNVVFKEIL